MSNTATFPLSSKNAKTALIDLAALMLIFLTPAISHLFNFPIYLLEPMRIMLIISIAHTNRRNAYLIALSLPLFSFLVSSHPSVLKSLLITGELFLNIWLFFYLSDKIKNTFLYAVISILFSKITYYVYKFLFINFGLMHSDLISTPLLLQLSVMLILSGYLYFFYNPTRNNK